MILGLRSAIYPTPELAEGKAWYGKVLGVEPYFDQPFYVGFSVGGFELGLIPDGRPGSLGAQPYWGVANIEAELKRLLALGAKPNETAKDVGGGIKVGSVLDPFGNLLCLIENPGFDPRSVR
jgi:catechol 2,3-dioxygenase-like lactoylglutathione lyase family enzyme